MAADQNTILAQIKTYLDTAGDAEAAFKQEVLELVSPQQNSTAHTSRAY